MTKEWTPVSGFIIALWESGVRSNDSIVLLTTPKLGCSCDTPQLKLNQLWLGLLFRLENGVWNLGFHSYVRRLSVGFEHKI